MSTHEGGLVGSRAGLSERGLEKSKIEQRYELSPFINRDTSWLHFNSRVLMQAEDRNIPLLERVNFLAIFTGNLDEFFMKRVGGLKRHAQSGVEPLSIDGLTAKQQLKLIWEGLNPQIIRAHQVFSQEIRPALEDRGVFLLSWEDLNDRERSYALDVFEKRIFPLLTPLAVDSGHPFPFLSNLSSSLGIAMSHEETAETLFARIKTSSISPQWIRVSAEEESLEYRFLSVNELIRLNLDRLFPRMQILATTPFRVTRNVELEVDEEEADDLRELMEEELLQRKRGQVVRLEHGPNPDPWILEFLKEELELHTNDIYELPCELDFSSLRILKSLPLPELKYPVWTPITPPSLREETSIFSVIRSHDILVHHPYESFASSVERFVREAVMDPKVRSIKMTVYRVGDETPIVPLLIEAAESGKNVVCLVELKARFDEERNIGVAKQLEEAGVHVIYGIPGVKIHSKTLLVTRDEGPAIRCYAHIGTGNYHSLTANLYTDLGLFTAKDSFTKELLDFFNFLTGRSLKSDYEKLLVAPHSMANRFLNLIEDEIVEAQKGNPAVIRAKMNNLEDRDTINALYRASQAGVEIDLYVRSVCCLRPGVPGLSENIRIRSMIGRLLEHSRVFYFRAGAENEIDGKFYIGSADWMSRNLHRRVEVVAPVEERAHRERIWALFEVLNEDRDQCFELKENGDYQRLEAPAGSEPTGTQEVLMQRARELAQVLTSGTIQ